MNPDERCPYGPPETLIGWIARLIAEDVREAVSQPFDSEDFASRAAVWHESLLPTPY